MSNSNNLGEGERLEGVKSVYVIDRYDKRKVKNSTNTLLLNLIEKTPGLTSKDYENRLVKSNKIALNYKIAEAVSKGKAEAKGREFKPSTLREYVSRRLKKTLEGYYLKAKVIKEDFDNIAPIIKDTDNKLFLAVIEEKAKS